MLPANTPASSDDFYKFLSTMRGLLPADPTLRNALIASLAAAALGLLGTLVTALVTWSSNANKYVQRTRQVELATKRLDFWEKWLKATGSHPETSELRSLREAAHSQMLDASKLMEFVFEKEDEAARDIRNQAIWKRKVSYLPKWRRSLLLYRPFSVWHWTLRVMFYSYACILGMVGLSFFGAVVSDAFALASDAWSQAKVDYPDSILHETFDFLWRCATHVAGRTFISIFYAFLAVLFFLGITAGVRFLTVSSEEVLPFDR